VVVRDSLVMVQGWLWIDGSPMVAQWWFGDGSVVVRGGSRVVWWWSGDDLMVVRRWSEVARWRLDGGSR
jgi:hypothetical protein